MQPTEYGVRLSPRMARAVADRMCENMAAGSSHITREQQDQMSERLARRMMTLGHEHGREVGELAEGLCTAMVLGGGRIPPEMSVEIGRLGQAAMPGLRACVDGFIDDGRSVLGDASEEKLADVRREAGEGLDRLGQQLDRWADGQREENERLGRRPPSADPEQPQRSPQIERAERSTTSDLRRMGPEEWRDFLDGVARTFNFDEGQIAEAEKILADYEERAKAVTTDEWRQRVRGNRERYHLRGSLRGRPLGPWLYHLDREYRELTAPLDELGRAFRREVMNLATDAQREAALASLQQFCTYHGLTADEAASLNALLFPSVEQ